MPTMLRIVLCLQAFATSAPERAVTFGDKSTQQATSSKMHLDMLFASTVLVAAAGSYASNICRSQQRRTGWSSRLRAMQAFAAASYVLSSDERSYNHLGSLACFKVMHAVLIVPHMSGLLDSFTALSLAAKATHATLCTGFTMHA